MGIVIVGWKGVGKTFLGKYLAEVLEMPFIDVDEEILSRISCSSISRAYQILGQQAFRELEKELILQIPTSDRLIISLGGGALREETFSHIDAFERKIYLDLPLQRAITHSRFWPSFITKTEEFTKVFQKRRSMYLQLSSLFSYSCSSDQEALQHIAHFSRCFYGIE